MLWKRYNEFIAMTSAQVYMSVDDKKDWKGPTMQCACYIAEGDGPFRLNPCPEHEKWAKAIRAFEREACAILCDQVARNAQYRAETHSDEKARTAALDKMEAAQLCSMSIRESAKKE